MTQSQLHTFLGVHQNVRLVPLTQQNTDKAQLYKLKIKYNHVSLIYLSIFIFLKYVMLIQYTLSNNCMNISIRLFYFPHIPSLSRYHMYQWMDLSHFVFPKCSAFQPPVSQVISLIQILMAALWIKFSSGFFFFWPLHNLLSSFVVAIVSCWISNCELVCFSDYTEPFCSVWKSP